MVTWENSQNLGTPLLVPPQTDVWKWLQKFHTGDVLCHYPDLSGASDCNFSSAHDQSEALPRSGYWHLNSMKFLQSFLRRHFTGTPVVVLKRVGCFLRLSDCCSVQLMQGCGAAGWDPSSCSFPKAPFIWRQVVMGRRDISLQNVVNCLREKQKIWPCLKGDPPSQEGEWRHCFTIVILYTFLKNATTQDPNMKGGVSRKFTQI